MLAGVQSIPHQRVVRAEWSGDDNRVYAIVRESLRKFLVAFHAGEKRAHAVQPRGIGVHGGNYFRAVLRLKIPNVIWTPLAATDYRDTRHRNSFCARNSSWRGVIVLKNIRRILFLNMQT